MTKKILIAFLFLISLTGFIFTPLTTDLRVMLSGANQTNYLLDIDIVNIFQMWDLKGVLNRFILFYINKISNIFAPFASGLNYEYTVKTIFSIFIIIVSFISCNLILKSKIKSKIIYTMALSSAFFMTQSYLQMQPEMLCTLTIVLAFSFYLSSNNGKHKFIKLFLAGFLGALVIFYKTIFALLAICFLSAVFILEKKIKLKEILIIISGGIVSFILSAFLIFIISPEEFQNILNASIYQETIINGGILNIKTLKNKLFQNFLSVLISTPFIFIGLYSGIKNLILNIKDKKLLFLRSALWLTPFLIIIISNKYFLYHYFLFMIPSLFEIYISDKKKKNVEYIFLSLPIIIYFCFISIFSKNFIIWQEIVDSMYKINEQNIKSMNIDKNEEFLYLDDGMGSYILGNKSCLKEYYPLQLQRIKENSKFINSKYYKNSLYNVLNYKGKYISIRQNWFYKNNKHKKIQEKIKNEYRFIGKIYTMSPSNSDFFKKQKLNYKRQIYIYERI